MLRLPIHEGTASVGLAATASSGGMGCARECDDTQPEGQEPVRASGADKTVVDGIGGDLGTWQMSSSPPICAWSRVR